MRFFSANAGGAEILLAERCGITLLARWRLVIRHAGLAPCLRRDRFFGVILESCQKGRFDWHDLQAFAGALARKERVMANRLRTYRSRRRPHFATSRGKPGSGFDQKGGVSAIVEIAFLGEIL